MARPSQSTLLDLPNELLLEILREIFGPTFRPSSPRYSFKGIYSFLKQASACRRLRTLAQEILFERLVVHAALLEDDRGTFQSFVTGPALLDVLCYGRYPPPTDAYLTLHELRSRVQNLHLEILGSVQQPSIRRLMRAIREQLETFYTGVRNLRVGITKGDSQPSEQDMIALKDGLEGMLGVFEEQLGRKIEVGVEISKRVVGCDKSAARWVPPS